jgi:hypothetical protein
MSFPAGSRAVVRYNYIYPDLVSSALTGALCTPDCTLTFDRRLGDIYYQYFYVDEQNKITWRGPVTPLPRRISRISPPAADSTRR